MSAPIKNLRWYIAGLLCLSTALNYLDRNALSVLAVTIQKELGLSTQEYSYVTSAFLFAYMIMYVVGGRIVDYLGTRRGLLIFVTGWSFANMAHALARTATMLSGFRFLLGVTEAANIPAGVKAVTEWFPVRERAMAVGIFNAGTAVGGALAVPVVSLIAATMGWRAAFVVTGAIGLVWVVIWALFYRLPQDHPRLGEDERALITEGDREVSASKVPLARLLSMPETWGCVAVRVLTDPISYFLNFWIAKYLQDERGFNLKDLAVSAWIPFVALALGNLASGAIPRVLVARGMPLDRARKRTMLGVALGMPLACFMVTRVGSAPAAVAVLSIVFFGHAAFGNVTMPAEIFPKRVVATVSGLGGTLGALSGWLTQLAIGKVVQALGFRPVFAVVSVLYLVAFVFIAGLVKDLGRIRNLT
jgi:ACS family hexuronate transporter-like MFS transporter